MDHIKNARNYRVLEDASGESTETNPLCGDEITVFLRIEGGRVAQIAFQCSCCGISMASASMMTEQVQGRRAEDARALARSFCEALGGRDEALSRCADPTVRALLETAKRYPARARCAALPWAALGSALSGAAVRC